MAPPELTGVRSCADGKSQSETRSGKGNWLPNRRCGRPSSPNRRGPLTLPPITLHWWNSQRQRMESTRLDTPPLTIRGGHDTGQPTSVTGSRREWSSLLDAGICAGLVVTLLFWWRTGHRLPRLPRACIVSAIAGAGGNSNALDTQDPQQIHRALPVLGTPTLAVASQRLYPATRICAPSWIHYWPPASVNSLPSGPPPACVAD